MCWSATLATDVSSTSMKVAGITATTTSQGLAAGRHSAKVVVAVGASVDIGVSVVHSVGLSFSGCDQPTS